MDAYLWSLDCLLQPTSHACASPGRRNPIGTVCHRTGGSSVAFTSQRLPCCEPSGLLGASVESAQSPPCGSNINVCRDGFLRTHGFLEILQCLRLGWEFQFLVPISGTPIVSGIPIPFSIPEILVRFFFEIPMSGESENWNSYVQYLEFW
jgi:hypothetical protein